MARKVKRGFKAPKNYDPNRGKKPKRGAHAGKNASRAGGSHSGGARPQREQLSAGRSARQQGGARQQGSHRAGDWQAGRQAGRQAHWQADQRQQRFDDRVERGGRDYYREDRLERGGRDYYRDDRVERGGKARARGKRRDIERFDRAERFEHAQYFDWDERAVQPRRGGRQLAHDRAEAEYRSYRRDSGSRVHVFADPQQKTGGDTPSQTVNKLQQNRRAAGQRSTVAAPRRGSGAAQSRSTATVPRQQAHSSQQSHVVPGFVPQPDVVLERLEAKQTTVADVEHLSFADLGLGDQLCRTLSEMGAVKPFPIQAATIPDVLTGADVLGRGRTGSGKTIAFGAALVERLLRLKAEGLFDADPQLPPRQRGKRREFVQGRYPKALIMAPTRELALQIDKTVQPLARAVGLFTTQVVGGASLARQQHALRLGVDIGIGTPGRVEDLIERGDLNIGKVAIAVLDEADHMAELGFIEPVQRIWRGVAPGAQKLLFSATLDTQVAQLVAEFLTEPEVHEVAGQEHSSSEHHVLVVLREQKQQVLTELLTDATGSVIVFTRTRAYAQTVRQLCEEAEISAVDLHGNLNQAKRERNLRRFAEGKARVLVATDVAARGIHVDDVALVVQADPPDDYKTYLHRAGRTGRAGSSGTVVTVIPRNRQKRTRQLLQNAQLEPAFFGAFEPGDAAPWREADFTAAEVL